MELDEAIAFIDDLLVAKTNQGLSDVEKFVFEGSWKGKTYDKIAADSEYRYTFSYLKQDAGPNLWKRLAQALGEPIGKTNFKATIERQWRSPKQKTQVKWELVWSATIDETRKSRVEAILIQLRELAIDDNLTMLEVKQGSVILVLEGSQAGFDRISELFKTGQLTEILGVPILDVRLQSATAPINWRQWLQNLQDEIFEPYWQQPQLVLAAGAHRGGKSPNETEAIAHLIRRLQTTNDETTRRQIATELGDILVHSPEAIAALTELLTTSKDNETLWQAALSLGKINPSHPAAGIKMAKAIDFLSETQSVTVALLVAFRPKNENKVAVRVCVEAIDEKNPLPNNLQVTVFERSGNAFRQAQPTNQDFLNIKGFSGSTGEQFSVQLSLGEVSITENFVI